MASTAVNRVADSFSGLSLTSRPMDGVLDGFRENKLEQASSTAHTLDLTLLSIAAISVWPSNYKTAIFPRAEF